PLVPSTPDTPPSLHDALPIYPVTTPADVESIWMAIGHQEAVVEKRISLQAEISVVTARGLDGDMVHYPPFQNRHRHHILDVTTRSEEHTSELQSRENLVCRLL